jgi:Leucine-rich repeat (LRR) protein
MLWQIFFFWTISRVKVVASVSNNEIHALEHLYNSTQGDHWKWRNEILFGSLWTFPSTSQPNPCSDHGAPWQGVSCSSTPDVCRVQECHIVKLSLPGYGLNGTLPNIFSQLSELTSLEIILSPMLVGSIPISIGSLLHLQILNLTGNRLSQALPTSLCLLSSLVEFIIDDNQLSGPIPSSIGFLWNNLETFSIDTNSLSGSLPPSLGSLSHLKYLWIFDNFLSGALPSTLGSLSQLQTFIAYQNYFTGFIPSSFGSLSQLHSFGLYYNHLTGSLPSSLGGMIQVEGFGVYNNFLTGSLPSELGSLSNVAVMLFQKNHFTDSIPLNFNQLHQLTELQFQENHLTGSMNLHLNSFPLLQQLFLQKNLLSNGLKTLVDDIALSNSSLFNLDVSDNLFTGSIPSQIFLLPTLLSVSLSLNCFQFELPSTLCQLVNVGALSMDGLGAARDCPNAWKIPLTGVTFGQTLEGSIPDCVWSLSKMKMLNLAGNGLRGTIGSESYLPLLSSLILSHNYLSGEIPSWLQRQNISHIDLSHNKLTGDLDDFNQLKHWREIPTQIVPLLDTRDNPSLKLTVNRLSGSLSKSLNQYMDLDLLAGNIFSCHLLPSNDQNRQWYSCGSNEFDQAMVVMGAVVGFFALVASICWICVSLKFLFGFFKFISPSWLDRILSEYQNLMSSMRFHTDHTLTQQIALLKDPIAQLSMQSMMMFGSLLDKLMISFGFLTALTVFVSLPIYIVKALSMTSDRDHELEYVTHSHMYRWLGTVAFLSGPIPAVLLLLVVIIVLFIFTWMMSTLYLKEESKTQRILPLTQHKLTNNSSYLFILFLVNVSLIGTLNGVYVWSTLIDLSPQYQTLSKFSLSFCFVVWNLVLGRVIPKNIKESPSGIWVRCCLYLTNTVIIPMIATTLTSPSCYQVSFLPYLFYLL